MKVDDVPIEGGRVPVPDFRNTSLLLVMLFVLVEQFYSYEVMIQLPKLLI